MDFNLDMNGMSEDLIFDFVILMHLLGDRERLVWSMLGLLKIY